MRAAERKAVSEGAKSEGPLWGVLLAAGRGTRMGRSKPLVPLGGRPLIQYAAQTLRAAPLDGLLVVTPPADLGQSVRAVLGPDWTWAENPDPARGLASSFRVAAGALPAGVAGAVFVLADMPFVPAQTYQTFCQVFRASAPAVVQAVYGPEEVAAPPLLLRSDLIAALSSLPDADQGPRELLRGAVAQTVRVPLPAGALMDIDTPDRLLEAEQSPLLPGPDAPPP